MGFQKNEVEKIGGFPQKDEVGKIGGFPKKMS